MPVVYTGKSGEDLLLTFVGWDGGKQRHFTESLRAPRHQHGITIHPRHITAFLVDGSNRRCISPSVKGFADVAKRFRWGATA